MALSDTFQPFVFYFEIPQGSHFHLKFPPFVDAATGDPFDFTTEAWVGRVDVVNLNGSLIASFATSGEAGTMTLGADGSVAIDLDASATAALSPTTDLSGTQSGGLVASLELTDPIDGEPWRWGNGRGRIRKQVTSG